MKFCGDFWTFSELGVNEGFKRLSEAGFKFIQWNPIDIFGYLTLPKREEIMKVENLAKNFGLNLLVLHGFYLLDPRIKSTHINKIFEIAEIAGSKFLVFHVVRDEWRKTIKQCLEISKLAEEYNVICGIENATSLEKWVGIGKREPKDHLYTPQEILKIVKEVNSENFKIAYDCQHAYESGYDIIEYFNEVKDFIVLMHISDHNSDYHIPIGEGKINFIQLFNFIKKAKFKGPIVLELKPKYWTKAKESLEKVKELWQGSKGGKRVK